MKSLAIALRSLGAHVFVDVSPLRDDHWTGIPVVAAELTRRFLSAAPEHVSFVCEQTLIPHDLMAACLKRRSGRLLALARAEPILTRTRTTGPSVGFFPSVKQPMGHLDLEFSVVHDLSTLITPQYHTPANVAFHAEPLYRDLRTNAVTFCVSQATLDDVIAYLGVEPSRLALMPNAVSWPPAFESAHRAAFAGLQIEPYVLVLGTREPRKNLRLIFDGLARRPDLARRHRFVFVGKTGWLADAGARSPILSQLLDEGAVVETGFVSEQAKYSLLRGALATIYPSLFEGFGLPVLESLSVGTPCICSFSSSLPEVGRDLARYIDPLSVDALLAALDDLAGPGAALDDIARTRMMRLSAERFDWDISFAIVARRIVAELDRLQG